MKKRDRGLIIAGCIVGAIVALVLFSLFKYGPKFGIWMKPPTPQQYAEYALTIMDASGIYSGTEEWKAAKASALEEFKTATSYQDTYETLGKLAKLAGGKHSFFREPVIQKDTASKKSVILFPEVETKDNILIIKLPEFSQNPKEASHYAEIVLNALNENRTPKGVVVDLRGNTGGDMNPMIVAVSPLLPNGKILSFGMKMVTMPITLEGFKITTSAIDIKMEPFKIPETTPIALLTDSLTASSGEATLLTFRGLANAKVFGTPTAGYVSGNTPIKLYDGASLVLTIGTDIARTGEVFCEDPVAPDFETETPLEDAIKWIYDFSL